MEMWLVGPKGAIADAETDQRLVREVQRASILGRPRLAGLLLDRPIEELFGQIQRVGLAREKLGVFARRRRRKRNACASRILISYQPLRPVKIEERRSPSGPAAAGGAAATAKGTAVPNGTGEFGGAWAP